MRFASFSLSLFQWRGFEQQPTFWQLREQETKKPLGRPTCPCGCPSHNPSTRYLLFALFILNICIDTRLSILCKTDKVYSPLFIYFIFFFFSLYLFYILILFIFYSFCLFSFFQKYSDLMFIISFPILQHLFIYYH